MKDWCKSGPGNLAITNYEKFNHKTAADQVVNEIRHLSLLALDESSRLAQGAGRQKWALIKSSKGVPYKLSCTATPAPNDLMEFASQASFLEKMKTEQDVIWTFFAKNKAGEWTVKRHAREAFYSWMASWSIYLMDPRKFGWRKKSWVEVPPAVVIRHDIDITPEQQEYIAKLCVDKSGQMSMIDDSKKGIVTRSKLSQVAKGFIYRQHNGKRLTHFIPSMKPLAVARIAQSECSKGFQTLVWTVFDAESDLIAEELRKLGVPFDLLVGKVKEHDRVGILERFRKGTCPLLVSRAEMVGFGSNFQKCRSMIYSGWNDSYIAFYQSRKRAERQGQLYSVRVHIPVIPGLEGDVLENLFIKEAHHLAMIDQMEGQYVKIIQEEKKRA
jgi:hypothetical protein